jgi:hypothetical protein
MVVLYMNEMNSVALMHRQARFDEIFDSINIHRRIHFVTAQLPVTTLSRVIFDRCGTIDVGCSPLLARGTKLSIWRRMIAPWEARVNLCSFGWGESE